jgi:hypothetical protein
MMAAPTYTVTHQEVGEEYKPDGTKKATWTVHLEHADGTKAHVKVDDTHYTAENVHALAQQQADEVAKVAALPASLDK